jgi:hypothetical protein
MTAKISGDFAHGRYPTLVDTAGRIAAAWSRLTRTKCVQRPWFNGHDEATRGKRLPDSGAAALIISLRSGCNRSL